MTYQIKQNPWKNMQLFIHWNLAIQTKKFGLKGVKKMVNGLIILFLRKKIGGKQQKWDDLLGKIYYKENRMSNKSCIILHRCNAIRTKFFVIIICYYGSFGRIDEYGYRGIPGYLIRWNYKWIQLWFLKFIYRDLVAFENLYYILLFPKFT